MFRSPLLGFKKFWLNHPDWQYLYILYSVYQKCFFFSCILYYAHSIMYSWQTFLWQINKKLWTTSDTHHILWFSKSLTQTHTHMHASTQMHTNTLLTWEKKRWNGSIVHSKSQALWFSTTQSPRNFETWPYLGEKKS